LARGSSITTRAWWIQQQPSSFRASSAECSSGSTRLRGGLRWACWRSPSLQRWSVMGFRPYFGGGGSRANGASGGKRG